MVKALGCGSSIRGFKSRHSPLKLNKKRWKGFTIIIIVKPFHLFYADSLLLTFVTISSVRVSISVFNNVRVFD